MNGNAVSPGAVGATPAELWTAYRATRSREVRDQLIVLYAPLVKVVAGRLGVDPSLHLDAADINSLGFIGLIDAIEKYDPERGVKFETYAPHRIRGAIIDQLRTLDWVPRSVRRNAKEIRDAASRLEHALGRSPSRAELAEELETDTGHLSMMLADESMGRVESLDRSSADGGSADPRAREWAMADSANDPGEMIEREEADDLLPHAITTLPERERLVVVLSFYEGLTLAAIGDALNVTESRVSQLRTRAVQRLRRRCGIVADEVPLSA